MKELAEFVRENQHALIESWMERVREAGQGVGQPVPELRDHMPKMIEALAQALETGVLKPDSIEAITGIHAIGRVGKQYDIRELVDEYRLLRRELLEAVHAAPPIPDSARAPLKCIAIMNEALDMAIGHAAQLYSSERERARDVFIGMLGHDLRTPLSVIKLSTQSLLRKGGELAQDEQKLLHRILQSAARTEKMIADLLEFARTHLGGEVPLERRRVDLRPVVDKVVRDLAAVHAVRTVRVQYAGGDFTGDFDPDRLEQVVTNLIENAVAHGQDPVEVALREGGGRIDLVVRNQGTIPPELIPRLFHPFKRSEGDEQGLGLGLFIVRSIACAHGGDVEVTSTAEEGTTVCVSLPRTR